MTRPHTANNNDVSAQFYDAIYSDWVSEELTDTEVDLILSLIPKNGSIMDLGCGTGRHLIKIAKKGIDILGVDTSLKMLAELKTKYPEAQTVHANIYKDTISRKFNLITLIWNAVMEIASTDKELDLLFSTLKSLLINNGKILIVNLYSEDVPAHNGLDFTETKEKNGQKYRLAWKVKNFDEHSNTTICEEKIELLDKENKPIKTIVSDLKQKWWRKNELDLAGNKIGFKMREVKVLNSSYHYYLFQLQ